jgi:hypothetical protein
MRQNLCQLLIVGSVAFISFPVFAQTSPSTPTGHEVNFAVSGYDYVEPGDTSISIHGAKFGGGYTGALPLNASRHWFLHAQAQGLYGSTAYDGWCSPFQIRPNSNSPNGYALGLGERSACSQSGDRDWYVEGRALVARDFMGRKWGWSPAVGLGIRHLSNGINGIAGYRTDDYLYVPVGITARTSVASRRALSFHVEYDYLLHGWQNTHDSKRGGGDVPATPVAPAFSVDGFSDISFDQHSGWALRAGAKYEITSRWSVAPEYIHWNVGASTVNYETATFTVNGITARQQLGFYEPLNTTDEFVVKLGFRF